MRRLVLALTVAASAAVAGALAPSAGAQQIPNPVHVYKGSHGEICFYVSEEVPYCTPVAPTTR